jgi:hypothetical protein
VLDEEVCGGRVEGVGDVDEPLVEDAALSVFDVDEDVSGDAGSQRQRFLGHAALEAQCADVASDGASPVLPRGDTLSSSRVRADRRSWPVLFSRRSTVSTAKRIWGTPSSSVPCHATIR